MKKYTEKYVNQITGYEQEFDPRFFSKIPSRNYNGREFPNGGWVLKGKEEVKTPKAAKPRSFTDKDADIIRKKIQSGERKGLTSAAMRKFAKHVELELDKDIEFSDLTKAVHDFVKGEKTNE